MNINFQEGKTAITLKPNKQVYQPTTSIIKLQIDIRGRKRMFQGNIFLLEHEDPGIHLCLSMGRGDGERKLWKQD